MKNQKIGKVLALMICAIFLFVGVSLGHLFQVDQSNSSKDPSYRALILQGSYTIDDQNEVIALDGDGVQNLKDRHTLYFTGHFNQDIPKNQQIILRIDNLMVEMRVNDKRVFSFGQPDQVMPNSKTGGNGWETFVSPGITKQDRVTITLSNVYVNHVDVSFNTFFQKMYSGYEGDLVKHQVAGSAVNFLISVVILCFGLITLIYSSLVYRTMNALIPNLCFAGLAIFSGIWFFIDFSVQNFLVYAPVFNNALDITCMLGTMIFLLLYFISHLKSIVRYVLLTDVFVSLILLVYMTISQLIGAHDFYDFTTFILMLSIITITIIIGSVFYEWWRSKHSYNRELLLTTAVLSVGMIADAYCFLSESAPFLFWFKISFNCFLLLQFWQIAKSLRQLMYESTKVEVLDMQNQELERIIEYQKLLSDATRGLYDNIYEIDITHNCAASEETGHYFESLGAAADVPYDQALRQIANIQIKAEYREQYMQLFSPENVLKEYRQGTDSLQYEFMILNKQGGYYWMRITTRIFYHAIDESIRMLAFRQNIDKVKRHEMELEAKAVRDSLTGVYNKRATEEMIHNLIEHRNCHDYLFLIFDIDDFKVVNDTAGHAVGDKVIQRFARHLKETFKEPSIVGRIGGDEFVAFTAIREMYRNEKVVTQMNEAFQEAIHQNDITLDVTVSVGVAQYPQDGDHFKELYVKADRALYKAKQRGKNQYAFYDERTDYK